MTPIYDYYAALVYAALATNVKHMVVAGSLILQDRQVLTMDEASVSRTRKLLARKRSIGPIFDLVARPEKLLVASGGLGSDSRPIRSKRTTLRLAHRNGTTVRSQINEQ